MVTADGDTIYEVLNEVIFIDSKGVETPLPLKYPTGPCNECPFQKGNTYKYIQAVSFPRILDNPNVNKIMFKLIICGIHFL